MPVLAEMIARNGRVSLRLAETLLRGITPETFARKPRFATVPTPTVVDTNHPAFVFGHLAIYPARLMTTLGLELGKTQPPAEYADLFAAGKECRDDPEGTIYPRMEAITAAFLEVHNEGIERLASVPDEILQRPNPNEKARERWPLLAGVATFYYTSHMMMHLGQVSAWRRCFGLGSAM